MNRKELEEIIFQTYGISPDYPWASTPCSVIRTTANGLRW